MINYRQQQPAAKIVWERLGDRYWLQAWGNGKTKNQYYTATDQQMEEIQAWCKATGRGRRMSHDEFRFKTEREMLMFLLRWS